jgi:hypothetical protein
MQVALLRNGEPLAVDVRRGVDFRQVWDVVVQAEEEIRNPQSAIRNPAEVVLTWPDLREVPSGVFLTLVDTATGTRRSLRTTRHYLYRPAEGETSRRFQIIAERSAPQVLQITDLQAEPTRGPGVRLTFTLTQAAQTNVVVRSLSGQAVQQIEILRSRETGANTTTWDGRDEQGRPVPNGVYLCEVTAHGEDGELARAMRTVRINR